MTDTTFILTPDHIKLIRQFNVDWYDDCYEGAPCVDVKRPYGNQAVANDICCILTGEVIGRVDSKRDELTKAEQAKYLKLHRETEIALQIILVTGSFEPGMYERAERYSYTSWRHIK